MEVIHLTSWERLRLTKSLLIIVNNLKTSAKKNRTIEFTKLGTMHIINKNINNNGP